MRTDLEEIGWKVMDWIHVAQERDKLQALEYIVMKLEIM
jgi:hypothetical protein